MSGVLLIGLLVSAGLCYAEVSEFNTDTSSGELRELAEARLPDESEYGCGPLAEPGAVYYVSALGDDSAAGTSPDTAWRSVARGVRELRAGDTLLIGEGEYLEKEIQINVQDRSHAASGEVKEAVVGAPGRPIRIMAVPGERVVLTGAPELRGFSPVEGCEYALEAAFNRSEPANIWESDTGVILQNAGSLARVDELPGTYWVDAEARKLYLRFSDSRPGEGRGVRLQNPRVGLRIHSSYVHLRGIVFTHYGSAVYARKNFDVESGGPGEGGARITIEDCGFFDNSFAGIHVSDVERCLFKNNFGGNNGVRGTILTQGANCRDNLLLGNRIGPSPQTLRSHASNLHYAINHYGGTGSRIHLVDNIMADRLSYRWKPVCYESIMEGNVFVGSLYTTGSREVITNSAERMILRNNSMLGRIFWQQGAFGAEGPGSDWAGVDMAFINNICTSGNDEEIRAARFADPAYMDYRLQGDSPFRGKALGGGHRGAYRADRGRILYVGPDGDDDNSGSNDKEALRTLSKAVGLLEEGGTLYIGEGDYDEVLELDRSGSMERPVRLRAYERKRVSVRRILVSGAYAEIEGLTVPAGDGPGVVVEGEGVKLRNLVVHGRSGAAILARRAGGLAVEHCTLLDSGAGLRVESNSQAVSLRDSLVAGNAAANLEIAPAAAGSFRGSHNVYFGAGPDDDHLAGEFRSVVAEPGFVDAEKGDFRQVWDSAAAYGALDGVPPGALGVLPGPISIREGEVLAIRSDSAAVRWRTPLDDTTGSIRYRRKDDKKWSWVSSGTQGTLHYAGMTGLLPGSEYEVRVGAAGRRGGSARGEVMVFRTPEEESAAKTYYLSPGGNDDSDGLSPETAWRTLRKACVEASPGDTVLLGGGVYEHVLSPLRGGFPGRRITFRAIGDERPIIDGGNVLGPLVALNRKNFITVDGLAFANPAQAGRSGVFQINNCDGLEIRNCRSGVREGISWRAGNFIAGGACNDLVVENNVSWGSAYHIWLGGCSNVVVRNNTFVDATMVATIFDGKGSDIRLENNIWYRPCIPDKKNQAILFRAAKLTNLHSDYNLFFSPYAHHEVGRMEDANLVPVAIGKNLAEWRAITEFDSNSAQADPLFVDKEGGDFRLRSGSPARGAGRDGADIGATGAALR